MARNAARFVNTLLCGLLTGNELGSIAAVHPAVASLAPPANIAAEQAVTARYGKIMPGFMGLTALSFWPVLALDRRAPSRAARLSLAGLLCYGTMIVVSLLGNVPINRKTLAISADAARPDDFAALRARWNRFHLIRNGLNLTGFTCVILANLAERR